MIAIGALGGSGTRAVAEVLIQAGIYMGDDLNDANDNLLFTRLFKDPVRYKRSSKKDLHRRLDIFRKYMSRDSISPAGYLELCRIASSNRIFPSQREFYLRMAKKILKGKVIRQDWGWKEPNTQIYVDHILEYFKNLKYIHVIRHGLDMAFSTNRQQLKNWGWKFDIHLSGQENEYELTQKQLDYWIRSNHFVNDIISHHPHRCLIIEHDAFCKDPVPQIDRMLSFCGIVIPEKTRAEVYRIPKDTGSNNRYTLHDIRRFSSDQLDQVIALGFPI
jgi:hypothetical protein